MVYFGWNKTKIHPMKRRCDLDIKITGRHVKVTEAMREFTKEKLRSVDKYALKIFSVHILMSIQKETHKCEINFDAKNMKLNAHASSKNMYESITKCVAKLDHQIRNHKTSLHDKHNRVATNTFEENITDAEGEIELQESA
jgi:putative sigma-54 modulation protein